MISMAKAATAQSRTTTQSHQGEIAGSQASQEELDKLQEIHELINLMFSELTARPPQSAAATYMTTALPPSPYSQPFFQQYWGAAPYTRPPGF
jgi:hypothetical protein